MMMSLKKMINFAKKRNMNEDKGQILLYQTPDGDSRIEVRLQGETVWLSLDQMAELFQRNKSTISRHIKNVFEEGELQKEVVVANFATTIQHGAIEGKVQTHLVGYFNLDTIISVGYRVHSYRGVQFLDFAELQAEEHRPMYMKDWIAILDDFLRISRKDILTHAGRVSAQLAKAKADADYDKFKERTKNELTPVEIHFLEQFEREQKKLSSTKV